MRRQISTAWRAWAGAGTDWGLPRRLTAAALLSAAALPSCSEPSSPPFDPTLPVVSVDAGSAPEDTLDSGAGSLVEEQPEAAVPDGGAADAGVAGARTPHAGRVSLVAHADWTRTEAADDPFGDRPASVYCADASTAAEPLGGESSYGVDTRDCNYVTVHQTSRDYVATGETLEVRLAHFELNAPSGGEAHLAVRLGEISLLDERVPIPSPSAVLRSEVVAPRDIPAGADLYFHVHNHGENSYALVTVTTGP